MDDFEKELKLGFLEEAAQSVSDVEQCFLQIESNPEDTGVLDKIFRLAHNLKGSSRAVGFDHMGHFTHEFESFLLKLKNGELPVTNQTISLMLRCNDHLNEMIQGLRDDLDATFDSTQLISDIENFKLGNFTNAQEAENTSTSELSAVVDEFEQAAAQIASEELANPGLQVKPQDENQVIEESPELVAAQEAPVAEFERLTAEEALPQIKNPEEFVEEIFNSDLANDFVDQNLNSDTEEKSVVAQAVSTPRQAPVEEQDFADAVALLQKAELESKEKLDQGQVEFTTSVQQVPKLELVSPVVPESAPKTPESTVSEPLGAAPVVSASAPATPAAAATTPKASANPSQQAGSGSGSGKSGGGAAAEESIRVSLSRVENLQNYVGEMVILQSVLREQLSDSENLLVKRTAHQLGKVVKEIQDISMSLRMVPVRPTFQKMQRIVRDTAQALGKEVNLKLIGEDTELDKTVLEKINDPLVHLIRNSVDHGVENAEIRKSRGKKVQGEVKLSAYHQSGKLVLEVTDDGGGLDGQKLKDIAIKKGVIKPGVNLSEVECWNLIFAPGFSTKEQTTDISGRGVGMDVVRTNIEELSGEIQIESVLGQGTTFRIFLPLTLAIIDGMVVRCAEERYVIPLSHVHESVQPTMDQVKHTTGLGDILLLRGENIPIYRLGKMLGRKSDGAIDKMIAIVIRSSGEPFIFLVDDIIGQSQVVVKQLGPELQFIKGVSGSTILGDGRPALIIEPADLVKRSKTQSKTDLGRAV